jgi:hypothetical protein
LPFFPITDDSVKVSVGYPTPTYPL